MKVPTYTELKKAHDKVKAIGAKAYVAVAGSLGPLPESVAAGFEKDVKAIAAKVEPGPDKGSGGDEKAVTVSGMGWSALGLVTGRELLEDESSCSYKEYDQESGETMGCGLAKHSAKQKHGNWRRL